MVWRALLLRVQLSWWCHGKLRYLDHTTIPVGDLGTAEAFYVGVPGAKIMMRIDARSHPQGLTRHRHGTISKITTYVRYL